MKTILFDLDGTILNTVKDLAKSINFSLQSENLPKRSENFIKKILGRGIIKSMKICAPECTDEETLKRLHKTFLETYSKHYLDSTLPYNGVKEMLLQLKEKYTLVILTNKKQEYAENLINKLLPNIFDRVQGAYDDKPRKPDPYLAEKVLSDVKCTKENAIYIGDTEVDYETGNNASLKTILVSYGFRNKKELLQAHSDSIIASSTTSLIKLIEKNL